MNTQRAATTEPAATHRRTILVLGVLGIVLAFTAEESLGYHVVANGLSSYALLCALQVPLACALMAWGPRLGSLVGRPRLLVGCGVTSATGCALYVTALSAGFSAALYPVALAFMALGSLAVKVLALELLSSVEATLCRIVLFVGVAAQALLAPVFTLEPATLIMLSLASTAAGLAVLYAACALTRTVTVAAQQPSPTPDRPAFTKRLSLTPGVLGGFVVLCVGVAYLNPMVLYPSLSGAAFVALGFGTHFAAAMLFGPCALKIHDSSYAFAFKLINTLALGAFILLALFGPASLVPRAVCTMTLSFFEFATFLAVADLASYSTTNRLRIFGGYYLAVRLGTVTGLLATKADSLLFPVSSPYSLIGFAIAMAVAVAAVWLTNEHNLHGLFWGDALQGVAATPGTAPTAGGETDLRALVEQRVESICNAHGLTEKEHEVLSLIAIGRSSTFIAEELSLSSNTVRKRIAQIYAKCDVHSKQELLTLVQATP